MSLRAAYFAAALSAAWLSAWSLRARADEAQAPAEAPADPPQVTGAPVRWDPAWGQFQTGEWIATGAGAILAIASRVLPAPTSHPTGGIGFDEGARNELRFPTPGSRRKARDGSDIGITISVAWPFFDALVVAGWYRGSREVGTQQALISAEVLGVTAGLQGLVSLLVSRERPYGRECGREVSADTRDCVTRDRYYSFYSGHSANSFAAAAANCMHHAYVPLYGGGAADGWACFGMFGVAATTAFLRVATDMHYASDVLTGAAVGTTTGLLLPWLLHYRHGASSSEASTGEARWTVLPMLSPTVQGLTGVLVF